MNILDLLKTPVRNAAGEGAGGGGNEPDPNASNEPAAPDYSWVPEQFLSEGVLDGAGLRAAYDEQGAELGQLREQMEAASAGVPESADGYELTFPEEIDYGEIQVPEGFTPQIDPEAPVLGEFRAWLHGANVPVEKSSELMGIMAKHEAWQHAKFAAEAASEREALGPNVEQRVNRLATSLENMVPDQGERQALMQATFSAGAFRALERIVSRQGGKPPTPNPTKEDLSQLTPEQRLERAFSAA